MMDKHQNLGLHLNDNLKNRQKDMHTLLLYSRHFFLLTFLLYVTILTRHKFDIRFCYFLGKEVLQILLFFNTLLAIQEENKS